jgi:Ca-activated chloride channel family protein
MLPPFFILFILLLTQKESHKHYFSDEVIEKLRVGSGTLSTKTRNIFLFFMGIFIVLALANPVIKNGIVEVKAKSADIMIALDISDSMLAEDVYPNRLKLAKQKAIEFLKEASNERVGVIAFAKNSYLVSPMSFDHSAVGFLLRQLNVNSITQKGTNYLSLLEVVKKNINKDSKKYLLILSDGGDKEDFTKEIAYAKENGIVVFILGIGSKKGAPIKKEDGTFIKYNNEIIISKLNNKISKFATSSGGVYIKSIKSNSDIKAMLNEISSIAKKKELKSEEVQKYIQLFYYPLAMAILLLLIATSSMPKRKIFSVVPIMFIMILSTRSEASMFDFIDLKEAKNAYEAQDYKKSAKIYSEYANKSKSADAYFNEGNALYKQKKYTKAIDAYQKAKFDSTEKRANNLGNIGNSYAKQLKQESLQKAIEFYENSLKLKEDKNIRENLEIVKKELKKHQEQKKKQNKKSKDKNNKDSKNNKNKDSKDDKSKDSKDNKSKKDDAAQKDTNKKEDSKDKKNSSKSKKSKSSQEQKKDDMKTKKEQEDSKKQNEEQNKKQEKQKLENLSKDKTKDKTKSSSNQQLSSVKNQNKMSDAEEKKWLKHLNQNQNTFMYKLNETKPQERENNEKPW